MPSDHILTFDDILASWREAEREADKRALWRGLAREGWFLACREAVRRQARDELAAWLTSPNSQQRDLIEFTGETAAQLVRTHLQCALLACTGDSLPSDVPMPGLGQDLLLAFSDQPLRPSLRDLTLTVLLVDTVRQDGVVAALALELIAHGSGDFYPTPALAFLRDPDFQQAERHAHAAAKAQGLWLPDHDVRWQLQRRDGKPITTLVGPSLGAAFALGIGNLCGNS